MAYRLAVENTVKVPVKFTLNDAGKAVKFAFTLTCDRLTQDEIKERMQNGDALVSEFMTGVIKDWHGQTLVVDEDGKPVDFTTDALNMMLGTSGVSMVVFNAYCKECGAKEKN
jgi:hypothetical protein